MRATFPIITCDSEDGCDQWTLDWFDALAGNWRTLMAPGWQFDPHSDAPHLCPEHAKETD